MPDLLRRSGRAELKLPVELRSATGSFAGVTQNVGVGGMFIATDQPRSVGDRLALTFTLPGGVGPISVQSEVRWIRKTAVPEPAKGVAGMGLRFVGLPILASVWIEDFLRRHERALREPEDR